jgi:DnaJ-class molecular chaperone
MGHEEENTMGNKPSSTNHPFTVQQEGTKLNPGDEGDPSTPGMAENVCRECKGTGKIGAVECPICGGTGVVYEEMGGA